MSDRVPLTSELVEAICSRVDASPLPKEDRSIIKAVLRDYLLVGQTFIEKSHTIQKLLRMLFGAKTEKAVTLIPIVARSPKVRSLHREVMEGTALNPTRPGGR